MTNGLPHPSSVLASIHVQAATFSTALLFYVYDGGAMRTIVCSYRSPLFDSRRVRFPRDRAGWKEEGKEKQRKGLCRRRSIYERAGMSSKENMPHHRPFLDSLFVWDLSLHLLLLVFPSSLPCLFAPLLPFTLSLLLFYPPPLLFEGGP